MITEENVGQIGDALGHGIDPEVRRSVVLFNRAGYTTTSSCGGHENRVGSTPYVRVLVTDAQAAGRLEAAARRFNTKYSADRRIKVRLESVLGHNEEYLDVHTLPSGGIPVLGTVAGKTQVVRHTPGTIPSHKELVEAQKALEAFAEYVDLLGKPGNATRTAASRKSRTHKRTSNAPVALKGIK